VEIDIGDADGDVVGAMKTGDVITDDATFEKGDGRFANRQFLISPLGTIVARYDKIHIFDAHISAEERYEESRGYRLGTKAVVADTVFGRFGLTTCCL
jgi:predicted amidohydrolase